MPTLPDVHAHDIEIPAGKVRLAEAGALSSEDRRPERSILDRRSGWSGQTEVRLVAATAGWVCAGSMMRWDNGYFSVEWDAPDGSRHGRRYRDYEPAADHFARIPA